MSGGTNFGNQSWAIRPSFPEDYIAEKWGEGLDITNLTYGDGVWAVVMSELPNSLRQSWMTSSSFPKDFIEKKWDEGFNITEVAYGAGVWAVVMSQ